MTHQKHNESTTADKFEERIKEIREDLKTRITSLYFTHISPKNRPEFKKLEEAENWHKQQNYIAEKIVGNWVDNTMIVVEEAIREAREEGRKEGEKSVSCIRAVNKGEGKPVVDDEILEDEL